MTREKQIADELKQEMAALNRRIARLNEWKERRYKEPCKVEHSWSWVETFDEHDLILPQELFMRYICVRCGMTLERKLVVAQETLFDEWQEYRENKGDDEE